MNSTVGFSTLNMPIQVLTRRPSSGWSIYGRGIVKAVKSGPISAIYLQPAARLRNGQHGWIQRTKYVYPRLNQASVQRVEHLRQGNCKSSENEADFGNISVTRSAIVKWMAPLD